MAGIIVLFIFFLSAGGIRGVSTHLDRYLLSCGAASTVADRPSDYDDQIWHSDNNSTFSDDFSSTITASTTTTTFNVAQVPFSTARIFTTNFTYSFPVSPGPKFIRLFFCLSTYSSSSRSLSLAPSDAYLTVEANSGNLLLRNFSAYLSFNTKSFMNYKEFHVYVTGSLLQLTFSPTSPSSYAFVNGIDVVSVPEKLYVSSPKYVAYPSVQYNIGTSTALETAYRVNVGGKHVDSEEDSGNLYRRWENDDGYLSSKFSQYGSSNMTTIKYTKETPNYSAPVVVYRTFRWLGKGLSPEQRRTVNVTWGFEVDLGFNYLVRLHWCELVVDINARNFRVFDVYIDGLMAEEEADVYNWASFHTAVYRDYVVYMGGAKGSEGRGILQLDLRPDNEGHPRYLDILLNGLEIFKINRSDGSLNAPNPIRPHVTTTIQPTPSTRSQSHIIPPIIGAIAGAILLAVLLYFLFKFRQRRLSKLTNETWSTTSKSKKSFTSCKSGSTKTTDGGSSSLPSELCRRFSLAEIKLATSDFSDSLIIGSGGFGNVYRGTVDGEPGPTTVAIKRLNALSKQGAREFTTEIDMLSKLRHIHLVSLVGYCNEAREMILVYEYMSRGTLRDHIFSSQLPWSRRLEMCLGAARGLHYLHAGANHMIIHRDVKSTNILLDEKWVAKVSDFGLSRLGPTGSDLSHVSTKVKGSFGYVDPEYYRRQQLTEKSDVYSFGVVLFEVLCGRAAVNLNLPKKQVNLAVWVKRSLLSGTLDTIVDPSLKREIAPACLRKFAKVAESCVRDQGCNRPSMGDVVWGLEFALELQQAAEEKDGMALMSHTKFSPAATSDGLEDLSVFTPSDSARLISTPKSDSTMFSGSSEGCGGSNPVFSQIFKPEGR